ncbi:DUF5123 domain-containing protein [Mariniflexile litorale]|uniref:DUF5123 domain-containing protein n=1 Tax=Mariniflexile litorale TaxID=3045158 RepID=A0AAU7EE71_9FLAO|nr:DUF5123 domain-containing protein [Mariniflexile sp. KMM 9835]MDQ8211712.1 DUF5123 domain-containing protein [Mariniflexile sp. KMM 9835]
MKNLNIKICYTLLLLVGVLFFNSCSDDAIQEDGIQLFRPVLNVPLYAEKNAIIVKMGLFKTAVGYKIELSRDNFATPAIKIIETTDPTIIIPNLLWNTTYQVRAMTYAADPQYNSEVAEFGEVKTGRFPSILAIPQSDDIIDNALNVRWTVSGSPVTTIKIFEAADEELANELASYTTTEAQQLTGLRSIKQLAASTAYTVAIYSDDVLRGFEIFTTKAALPTTGDLVDARGDDLFDPATDDGTYLNNKIAEIMALPNGGTLILDGDQEYIFKGTTINNSIKIISGYSLNTGGAKINVNSNFNIANNASIDHVILSGLKLDGRDKNPYFLNVGDAASFNINTYRFENCYMTEIRTFARIRSGVTGAVNNFEIDNCSLFRAGKDYYLFTYEGSNAGFTIGNVKLTRSTFQRTQRLLRHAGPDPINSIIISDCTLGETTLYNNVWFELTPIVTNGIKFTNSLIGRAWDNTTAPGLTNAPSKFLKLGNGSIVTFENTFQTNDVIWDASYIQPTIPVYNGTVSDLWVDSINGDFNIKDKTFVGRSTSGDPRWRL